MNFYFEKCLKTISQEIKIVNKLIIEIVHALDKNDKNN